MLLDRVFTEACGPNPAEAGTLYLGGRRPAPVRGRPERPPLAPRLGEHEIRRVLQAEPLRLERVEPGRPRGRTRDLLNLGAPHVRPDARTAPPGRVDARLDYRARSVLVVPLPEPWARTRRVLQLSNPLARGRSHHRVDLQDAELVRSLASQAAITIRDRPRDPGGQGRPHQLPPPPPPDAPAGGAPATEAERRAGLRGPPRPVEAASGLSTRPSPAGGRRAHARHGPGAGPAFARSRWWRVVTTSRGPPRGDPEDRRAPLRRAGCADD